MNPVFPEINLGIMSLKNFQDAELAYKVISRINACGKDFIPQVFGVYEPLKLKYDEKQIQNVVDLWMNEENHNPDNNFASGILMMDKKKAPKVEYMMKWIKDNSIRFNSVNIGVGIDYFRGDEQIDNFMSLCRDLVELLEPVYGSISNCNFPGWEQPINLRIRLPDIAWGTIYGEPYIEMFGREKLLQTPCYKVETIGSKAIFLQAGESILDPVEESTKVEIKKYLDEYAFVWGGKMVHYYKTGNVPEFDFSEIMYDKTKPVRENHAIRIPKSETRFQR